MYLNCRLCLSRAGLELIGTVTHKADHTDEEQAKRQKIEVKPSITSNLLLKAALETLTNIRADRQLTPTCSIICKKKFRQTKQAHYPFHTIVSKNCLLNVPMLCIASPVCGLRPVSVKDIEKWPARGGHGQPSHAQTDGLFHHSLSRCLKLTDAMKRKVESILLSKAWRCQD